MCYTNTSTLWKTLVSLFENDVNTRP